MQAIVLQPVKMAGWSPPSYRFTVRKPLLAQAATPATVIAPAAAPGAASSTAPAKPSVIDSGIFNFFINGLGAFATGSLAFGAAATKATTAATLLGIVSGGLGIMALYNLSTAQKS